MAQPSHRLTLLRKFEKQIAGLERHHVDFLGLCEDTREEIQYLERQGKIERKHELHGDGKHGASKAFAKYGAAVGDQRATLESDVDTEEESRGRRDDDDVVYINAGEDGREQGADTAYLVRREFAATDENNGRFRHARAKRALRKAKSLKEPPTRSKWFGIFTRRKPASIKSPSPAPAPQRKPDPMRTLEPRPSASAEGSIENDKGGRVRRRLSKVQRSMGSKRGGGYARDEGVKEKDEDDGSWESGPKPQAMAFQIRENERSKYPSSLGNNEEEEVWGSGDELRRGHGGALEKGAGRREEQGSDAASEHSVITYNDANEIGRATRIRILDRWRREKEARQ